MYNERSRSNSREKDFFLKKAAFFAKSGNIDLEILPRLLL